MIDNLSDIHFIYLLNCLDLSLLGTYKETMEGCISESERRKHTYFIAKLRFYQFYNK